MKLHCPRRAACTTARAKTSFASGHIKRRGRKVFRAHFTFSHHGSQSRAVLASDVNLGVCHVMPARAVAPLARSDKIIDHIVSPVVVEMVDDQHFIAGAGAPCHHPTNFLPAPMAVMPSVSDAVVKHNSGLGDISILGRQWMLGRINHAPHARRAFSWSCHACSISTPYYGASRP